MVSLRHSTAATGTNNAAKQVSVNAWNADHTLTGTANKTLAFDNNGYAADVEGAIAVALRTALALVTNQAAGATRYLTESGREGLFVWSAANLQTQVTRDPQQGIYVPPTGQNGSTGAWVRKFDGPHNVKWWGAKGDAAYTGATGTDDTAAIQAALGYLDDLVAGQNRGGTLFFPHGHYKCASGLNAATMTEITLLGPASSGVGYTTPPPAQIIYTGAGSGIFLDARSTYGFTIRNLGIRYTSASFTGVLISYAQTIWDSCYGLIERCLIGGHNVQTAARLIDLHEAILCSIVDNHIGWGVVGIGGRKAPTVDYSNAHYIGRNTFDHCTVSAILNAGESWNVTGNWFEGTSSGASLGMPRAYFDDLTAGQITGGLRWVGNWHGDAVNVGDAWFCNGGTSLYGTEISGNLFSTYPPGLTIKLTSPCYGLSITGNNMQYGPDFGAFNHQGVTVTGNWFFTAGPSTITAASSNVFIAFNSQTGGLAATQVRFGAVGTGAVATPEYISLGGSYSSTPGTNAKLRIFDNGAGVHYGIGNSAGQQDYNCPAGAIHAFYIDAVLRAQVTTTGIVTSGIVNANSSQFTGSSAPASGTGVEVLYSGGGFIQAYNRTGSSFQPMTVQGSTVSLSCAGTAIAVATNTGLAITGALSCTGNAALGDAIGDAHTANGTLAVTGAFSCNGNATLGDAVGDAHVVNGTLAGTNAITSSHATAGIGYATGAGGAVTQITSRTTGVTINKASGAITLVSAAGSTTFAAFTVTNSAVAATDTIVLSQKSGTDKYHLNVTAVGAGSFEISFATISGTTVEQPVFNFAVLKATAA